MTSFYDFVFVLEPLHSGERVRHYELAEVQVCSVENLLWYVSFMMVLKSLVNICDPL